VAGKSIMESAQEIWLAGMGAFAKAQGGGGKLFETLLREGASLEQKTRKLATGKVDEVRGAVETGVTQVRERTQETWDKLEQVFENRVSRALGKLARAQRRSTIAWRSAASWAWIRSVPRGWCCLAVKARR